MHNLISNPLQSNLNLEIIQSDLLQIYEAIDTLPEAQLIFAIITQAWNDANKGMDCSKREEVRQWFFSEQFEHYCYLINIDASVIQSNVARCWKNHKGEKRER